MSTRRSWTFPTPLPVPTSVGVIHPVRMGTRLLLVLAPRRDFVRRIGERQEPMRVRALGTEAPVKRPSLALSVDVPGEMSSKRRPSNNASATIGWSARAVYARDSRRGVPPGTSRLCGTGRYPLRSIAAVANLSWLAASCIARVRGRGCGVSARPRARVFRRAENDKGPALAR